jgi:hypothetical protein
MALILFDVLALPKQAGARAVAHHPRPMKWQLGGPGGPRYRRFGTPSIEGDESWHVPDESAIVMRPERDSESDA